MKRLLRYRLITTLSERQKLTQLLKAYNGACDALVRWGAENHRYNFTDLRDRQRTRVANEFGLPAGLATGACQHMAFAFSHLNQHENSRVKSVVPKPADNNVIMYNTATASVKVPLLHPWQVSKLPVRLSLSALGERMQLRYRLGVVDIPTQAEWFWQDDVMGLGVMPDGEWRFWVVSDLDDDAITELHSTRPAEMDDADGLLRPATMAQEAPLEHPSDIDREPLLPADIDEDYMPAVDDED